MKRSLSIIFSVIAALLLTTGPAFADAFVTGDVFASVGNGQVQRWSSAGVLLETFTVGAGFTTGSGFDSSGNLYVTNFSAGTVMKVDNGAVHTVSTFASGINASPESVVFDAAGNVYVGSADGNRDIHKYSATGTLLATYDVATGARGSDWIDLAADQATMFYTSEDRTIFRYDVSTSTQLSSFAVVPGTGPLYALRLLGDGGLLVADQNVGVRRLNAAGAVVQNYSPGGEGGFFSLNLDPDGTSFWTGSFNSGKLYKMDITTGALLQTISTGSGSLFGVSVFGEKTQAVPEPGILLLLGSGLAYGGYRRRQRKP